MGLVPVAGVSLCACRFAYSLVSNEEEEDEEVLLEQLPNKNFGE